MSNEKQIDQTTTNQSIANAECVEDGGSSCLPAVPWNQSDEKSQDEIGYHEEVKTYSDDDTPLHSPFLQSKIFNDVYHNKLTLKKGDTGQHILELKSHLGELGYSIHNMDQVFDDSLEQTIMLIQTQHRILVDGKVGAQTLRNIDYKLQSVRKESTEKPQYNKSKNNIKFLKIETTIDKARTALDSYDEMLMALDLLAADELDRFDEYLAKKGKDYNIDSIIGICVGGIFVGTISTEMKRMPGYFKTLLVWHYMKGGNLGIGTDEQALFNTLINMDDGLLLRVASLYFTLFKQKLSEVIRGEIFDMYIGEKDRFNDILNFLKEHEDNSIANKLHEKPAIGEDKQKGYFSNHLVSIISRALWSNKLEEGQMELLIDQPKHIITDALKQARSYPKIAKRIISEKKSKDDSDFILIMKCIAQGKGSPDSIAGQLYYYKIQGSFESNWSKIIKIMDYLDPKDLEQIDNILQLFHRDGIDYIVDSSWIHENNPFFYHQYTLAKDILEAKKIGTSIDKSNKNRTPEQIKKERELRLKNAKINYATNGGFGINDDEDTVDKELEGTNKEDLKQMEELGGQSKEELKGHFYWYRFESFSSERIGRHYETSMPEPVDINSSNEEKLENLEAQIHYYDMQTSYIFNNTRDTFALMSNTPIWTNMVRVNKETKKLREDWNVMQIQIQSFDYEEKTNAMKHFLEGFKTNYENIKMLNEAYIAAQNKTAEAFQLVFDVTIMAGTVILTIATAGQASPCLMARLVTKEATKLVLIKTAVSSTIKTAISLNDEHLDEDVYGLIKELAFIHVGKKLEIEKVKGMSEFEKELRDFARMEAINAGVSTGEDVINNASSSEILAKRGIEIAQSVGIELISKKGQDYKSKDSKSMNDD